MVHIPHLPFSCLCSPSFWCLVPGPRNRRPFSLTYGANLPSSLTMLLPIVLGFSPHLPVSVCGTGAFALDSGFSRQCGISRFGTLISLPVRPSNHPADFPARLSISLGRALPAARSTYPPASPPLSIVQRRYRNFNLLSIAYASPPRLRSRLTLGGRTFPRKPWVFDGKDSHFTLATYSGILTTASSSRPSGRPSTFCGKLPYHCIPAIHSFGTRFQPR